MTKTDEYVTRLMTELPPTTRGGRSYIIRSGGYSVAVLSTDMQKETGHYTPTDYPLLFGWNKKPRGVKELSIVKPPRFIEYKGYRYVRLRPQK